MKFVLFFVLTITFFFGLFVAVLDWLIDGNSFDRDLDEANGR